MCGIAGFWDFERASSYVEGRARVQAMTNAIAHRGPDGDGMWSDPGQGIFLGHRRLAIVDLSPAGSQPMESATGRYNIVYNGEIYNHRELRAHLDRLQQRVWRGHSDTEVLLVAIEQWGLEAALQACVGMFAIALWDRQVDTLWLARDRLGEKPLYFALNGRKFVFGSELVAMRASGVPDLTLNPQAMAGLLRNGYVGGGLSIHAGISQLAPGTLVSVNRSGGIEQHRYWRPFGARQQTDITDEEALQRLEQLLSDTVRQQLMADVPVGAFLSGGVDSSLISALGQHASGGQLNTFTIGFEEAAYNEVPHAAAVARHLGTNHEVVHVTGQDVLGLVPYLASLYGEPFADPSALPTALLMQAARRKVKVALSGDAGDELFAGYARYLQYPRSFDRQARIPLPMRRVLACALGSRFGLVIATAGRALGRPMLADQIEKYLPLLQHDEFGPFARDFASLWRNPGELMQLQFVESARGYDWAEYPADLLGRVEQLSRYDLVEYLPQDILVKIDRAAMAASLETRTPLLDHRVVEFAFSLPMRFKLRDGRGKWLLRELLQKYVPSALIDRPKQGFKAPIGPWLRGPLREWASDLLAADSLRTDAVFHPQIVQRYWQEHLLGQRDWSRRLWPILMYQQWREALTPVYNTGRHQLAV